MAERKKSAKPRKTPVRTRVVVSMEPADWPFICSAVQGAADDLEASMPDGLPPQVRLAAVGNAGRIAAELLRRVDGGMMRREGGDTADADKA